MHYLLYQLLHGSAISCEIYNTLLDWHEIDLNPHTSQEIYFPKSNENKQSENMIITSKTDWEPFWQTQIDRYPDSKVHVANMRPTWVLSAPCGPHVGPINLAIRVWRPRRDGHHFVSNIFRWISWKFLHMIWSKFQWTLFPRVRSSISQLSIRYWLGAEQSPSHYLHEWRLALQMHVNVCATSHRVSWADIFVK